MKCVKRLCHSHKYVMAAAFEVFIFVHGADLKSGSKKMTTALIGILEDDNDLIAYLASNIERTGEFEIAFLASSLSEAKTAVENSSVDICLVDIDLPDGSGLDFAALLKKTTNTKVLILTVLGDRKSVISAFKSGADGYVLKDATSDQIRQHIIDVLAGDTPISPQAATHLLRHFKEMSSANIKTERTEPREHLTNREYEVLELFKRGLTYRETANALSISTNTVSTYVKSIYGKLEVNSRSEAIYEAGKLGWLAE